MLEPPLPGRSGGEPGLLPSRKQPARWGTGPPVPKSHGKGWTFFSFFLSGDEQLPRGTVGAAVCLLPFHARPAPFTRENAMYLYAGFMHKNPPAPDNISAMKGLHLSQNRLDELRQAVRWVHAQAQT